MLRFAVIAMLTMAALPAASSAGGWATVQLDSTPEGVRAGEPWDVRVTVLQHGRTRLNGVSPSVSIRGEGEAHAFPAAPSGRPGEYRARVVFPAAGDWRYSVDDDFSQVHQLGQVEIGSAGAGEDDSVFVPGLLGLAALGITIGAVVGLRRIRSRAPA